MPSIKSPIAKVSLTGTILAVVAAGSFGVFRQEASSPRWHRRYRCCRRRAYPVGAGKPQGVPSPSRLGNRPPRRRRWNAPRNAFGKEGAQATGEIQAPFPTSADAADMLVQLVQGWRVHVHPKYGPVAVESGVSTALVEAARVQRLCRLGGLPVSWRSKKGVLYTGLKAELYWDKANGLPRNTNVLGPKDALVIGDSQVTATSLGWFGSEAGRFRPYLFRCGGIGFVTAREGCVPLLLSGVMGGRWALPSGNPGDDLPGTPPAMTFTFTRMRRRLAST